MAYICYASIIRNTTGEASEMGFVDTGSGFVFECDNCRAYLEEDDPVVVWRKRGQPGPTGVKVTAQTRGCENCADAAIAKEFSRGVSLNSALRMIRNKERIHARQTWCEHCGRTMYFITETKYKGDYARVAYCSDYCREAKRGKIREPVTCTVCFTSFIPKRRDAKTCSPACKQKAYRMRRAGIHPIA